MTFAIQQTIPILRIFSIEKVREFYIDYLGFTVDWEHRFEEGLPLYMQVSRGDWVLHLTEHYGDCSPGAAVYYVVTGLDELHQELTSRNYGYLRPGIEDAPWGGREMGLIDPFNNRLRLHEDRPSDSASPGDPDA